MPGAGFIDCDISCLTSCNNAISADRENKHARRQPSAQPVSKRLHTSVADRRRCWVSGDDPRFPDCIAISCRGRRIALPTVLAHPKLASRSCDDGFGSVDENAGSSSVFQGPAIVSEAQDSIAPVPSVPLSAPVAQERSAP